MPASICPRASRTPLPSRATTRRRRLPSALAACLAALGTLAALGPAAAHEGVPRVWSITFHGVGIDDPWVVDEMGLLLGRDTDYVWLCDDAISLTAGMRNAAPLSADGRWVLTTREGVFTTDDGGCSFVRAAGSLEAHFVGPLSVDPRRNGTVLVGTASLGRPNGTYLSTDFGRTWALTGEASDGRVRDILRAPGAPERVFVADGQGLAVSDDGGERFVRRAFGPAELAPRPEEIRLLGVDPRNADRLFVAVERFPNGVVVVSDDAGLTWRTILEVPDDSVESIFVDPNGPTWLLSTPFSGLWRSETAGAQWTRIEAPGVLGCLTAEPVTGHIWACLRGSPMPWVIARSEDGGDTWAPQLRSYGQIQGGLDCPAASPTAVACQDQCEPVNRTACAESDAGPAPVEDSGPTAADAAPREDQGGGGGGGADARPGSDETAARNGSGCDISKGRVGNGGLPGPPGLVGVLAILGLLGRRRRPGR